MSTLTTSEPTPVVVCLADVAPEQVEWLWPGRVPLGKLSLLVGNAGLGKSLVTLDMAARVSKGTPWPDQPDVENSVGSVVLLSAEDDLADTIRPRLDAAGADVTRVHALQSVIRGAEDEEDQQPIPFCLTSDLSALERAIEDRTDCRLVVVDPITAYLGKTDANSNNEVRAILAPLAELASRHDVAVLGVTHMRKGEGAAIHKAIGSVAFVAAARASWLVCRDQDDESLERRLMLPIKNNLGKDSGGLAFTVSAKDATNSGTAFITWLPGTVTVSADDALAEYPRQSGSRRNRWQQTINWLRDYLADGPKPAADVISAAKDAGISAKRVRGAYGAMGGEPRKQGFDGGWVWQLPSEDDQDGQGAPP